ncbi:hypothetical protein JCM21714_10 [Gracilibacillus boraciitolerans JCM 21714]|uniref:Uncharacterized protein n=1 Tax=Gracilibacillus boraciitolerans JCM 21714 TaxID=1298598 RepID=W4VCD2_9BACI|nr:hypothetical protein [Gracilibacillus boraciitolerans]GAE91075.1 hypothetical protein JCM21714_10 [Gracilibacillus boraciitolerans JCM 21714]
MLKHDYPYKEQTLEETTRCIVENHNGIYAYPHESQEEREETDRLMKVFIKKNNQ